MMNILRVSKYLLQLSSSEQRCSLNALFSKPIHNYIYIYVVTTSPLFYLPKIAMQSINNMRNP